MGGSFFASRPEFHAMSNVHFFCILCGTALQTSSDTRHDLMKCHGCSRHVPVPRPANLTGDFSYLPAFPPQVLELAVKFQCAGCGVVMRADARCEGRRVACDDCGAKTTIPRWSNLSNWTRFSEAGVIARMRAIPMPGAAAPPTLSVEEIDFLRGAESRKPESLS